MSTTIDTAAVVPVGRALPDSLQLVVRDEWGSEREVELTFHHAGATVADLAVAVGLLGRGQEGGDLLIDGARAPAGLPLPASGVRRGSVVAVAPGAEPGGAAADRADVTRPGAAPGVLRLRTLAGPDAGRDIPLGPGVHVLGRGSGVDVRLDDPVMARRQAVVEVSLDGTVELTELASPRPTRVDGTVVEHATPLAPGQRLVAGSTTAEVAVAPDALDGSREPLGSPPRSSLAHRSATPDGTTEPPDRRAGRGRGESWTRSLHRPPPPAGRPLPAPVAVPSPRARPASATPLGIATLLGTLFAGAVVALVLHQPAFLLLGAVGAVGTLGTGLWQRARQRARRNADRGHDQQALARFAAELASHQAAMAERLRTETSELVDAVACGLGRGPALWARRLGDPAALTAVVGRGERWAPPSLLGERADLSLEAWALVEAASMLADVPVPLDLGPGAVLGVVGPRPLADALARSLVLQLAVAHGPADLLISALLPPGAGEAEPSWLRWLPHTREPATGESLVAAGTEVSEVVEGRRRLLTAAGRVGDGAGASAGASTGPGGTRSGGALPHLLAVVADPTLLSARNAPLRQLLAEDASASVLVVADAASALPGICTSVVEVRRDGTATSHCPGGTGLVDHVAVAGVSAGTARSVALALAGLDDPEQPAGASSIPPSCSLASLLGPVVADPARMRAQWLAAGTDPPLRTLLAEAADGPIELDLGRDGPHALVAGTTGAGKSELLRSLVAGLAAGTAPDRLAFVLIDYKGGAAFDACADLPHVAGLVTDLDEHLAERALRSLDAELRRRERILREAGVPDLATHRALPGLPPLARLVVVVDEFATLASDLPDFVRSLVGVAQRGRSLGVHLILATQRPAGAVSDDIRANTNLRIALRVQDGADSVDVVGDPVAAGLPRHRPGRAVLRLGPGELVPAQVAAVTTPWFEDEGRVLTARPLGGSAGASPGGDAPGDGAPSVLDVLVRTAQRAAAELGVAVHRPWLPALPEEIAWEDLPPGAAGVVDDPDQQSQPPWRWDASAGHLLCVGMVGAGVTAALTSVALAAAADASPGGVARLRRPRRLGPGAPQQPAPRRRVDRAGRGGASRRARPRAGRGASGAHERWRGRPDPPRGRAAGGLAQRRGRPPRPRAG